MDHHDKSSIQQEESFHHEITLTFKEETNEMIRLEHSFVWY